MEPILLLVVLIGLTVVLLEGVFTFFPESTYKDWKQKEANRVTRRLGLIPTTVLNILCVVGLGFLAERGSLMLESFGAALFGALVVMVLYRGGWMVHNAYLSVRNYLILRRMANEVIVY